MLSFDASIIVRSIACKLSHMSVLPMIPTENIFSIFLNQFIFPWSFSFMRINKTQLKLLLIKML